MMMKLKMTHMSSLLNPLVAMEKGQLKNKSRYKPHPKKSHQAPYVHQSRPATRVPPKHKQGVAAHICPKTPPRLIPTLPPNVRVVDTPIKIRDPGSVLGFAEHMIKDYSRNSLVVREQREENIYLYLKGEGLPPRFLTIRDPQSQASFQEHGSHCANEVH
jgi:hypothetical protein